MSPMTNSSARKRHTESTTPKENPMVTIATPPQFADDLHAIRTEATTATSVLAEIRDLLDERLPSGVDHPGGQSNELNNDDPDEALARAMYERADVDEPGTWPPNHPDDLAHWMRLARAAREHIEGEREEGGYNIRRAERERKRRVKAEAERDEFERKWRSVDALDDMHNREASQQRNRAEQAEAERDYFRGACNSWQSAAQETEYLCEKFRAERDEWQREFEQADNLLSRTRDERDKYASKAEWWAHRHAALREDVDRERINAPTIAGTAPLTRILARDDERADQS